MKKKKIIFAATTMIIAGAVLMGVGLVSGGETNLSWREGRPQVSNLITSEQIFSSSKIKKINIDSKDADLEIISGPTLKVESYLLDQKPEINVQEQNLNIKARKSPSDFNLGINFGKIVQEKIIITIPNGMNLNKMIIEGTSGQKTLRDFRAENFQINLRDGGLSLENVNGKNLALSISDAAWQMRDVDLSGSLKVKSGDGASILERVSTQSMDFVANDGASIFENLRLQERSKLVKRDGQLKLINSQFPGIKVEAENAYVNQVKEKVPYQRGNQDRALTVKVTEGSFYLINE